MPERSDTSDDTFFGGRLRLKQLRHGHRAGHDAVLLAASVAAKADDVVIDLGAGIGAAGLGVAMRVPGISLTLVEIDSKLCGLAAENAERNHFNARVVNADVTNRASLTNSGLVASRADAVLMNPPFNDSDRHQASPDQMRSRSHIAADQTLADWTRTALWLLKPRGMLTLIWRADGLADVLETLDRGCGGVIVQPVHPAPSKPASRVLIRAVKESRAPLLILPGLVLDGTDAAVQNALIGQGGLSLAECRNGAARVTIPARSSRPRFRVKR